jgi:hypothetical protein
MYIFVRDSFCVQLRTENFVQQGQRAEKKVSYYVLLIFKAWPTAIFYQPFIKRGDTLPYSHARRRNKYERE